MLYVLVKDNLLHRVFAVTDDDDIDTMDITKEPVVAEAVKETTRGAVRKEPDQFSLPGISIEVFDPESNNLIL